MYSTIIVEDDPMVASINEQYLKMNPEFAVKGSFRNGQEALEYMKNHAVQLAIVDYYMPLMDGREFVRACRSHKLSLDIIMITAANSAQEISGMLKLGVVDYLVKPFTYERFQGALQKYLQQTQVFGQKGGLAQEEIDRILAPGESAAASPVLEKGLQQQTLELIREYMKNMEAEFVSSNEVAQAVHLSRITVRRYMNFLVDQKEIISKIDYGTGGRPSIKYRRIR